MRYLVDSKNKTISLLDCEYIEEFKKVMEIYSGYKVTPLLDFPKLNENE